MPWVYILKCADGSYYTGSTKSLERRIAEHQIGEGGLWTKNCLPVKLVFAYEVHRIDDAFELERQVKGWRREKKIALINGRYDLLPALADTRRPSATLREPQDV
ncbi:MAG: GIY-YIG nuclease family protein [Chloroflexi bacterium]|nr:GIY-YIG nuclease family protein [Chloroflexota bacterium]